MADSPDAAGSRERVAFDLYARLIHQLFPTRPKPEEAEFAAAMKAHLDLFGQCLNVVKGGDADVTKLKRP